MQTRSQPARAKAVATALDDGILAIFTIPLIMMIVVAAGALYAFGRLFGFVANNG